MVSVMEAALLDGTAKIVTRRALDTVSTMLHVTRGPVCVLGAVMLVGVDTYVTKVSSLKATYTLIGKKQLLKTLNYIHV